MTRTAAAIFMHEKLEMASEQIDLMIRQAETAGNASCQWPVCDENKSITVFTTDHGRNNFRVSVQ